MQLDRKRVWVAAFLVDRTEVTRLAYKGFLDATGYRPPFVDEAWANDDGWNWSGTDFPAGTDSHPVVITSWHDASAYCAWTGGRLPTEAEWQLAALGQLGHGQSFPWGSEYDGSKLNHGMLELPNIDDSDGFAWLSPVGSYPAGNSPYGLADTFGNAWEFTSDFRVDSWEHTASRAVANGVTALRADGPGLYVAVRGGSYYFDLKLNPGGERNHFLPEVRRKTSGFRCAK
jgi:formylglycine-generating enzyme required for sulfatase activity